MLCSEVAGPAPDESERVVGVRFPGNEGQLYCYVTTIE
jgi:hypothetical protein